MPRPRPVLLVSTASLALLGIAVGQLGAGGGRGAGNNDSPSVGPDVIVGALPDVSNYGTVGGISAYAIGTTSCNIGDALLSWIDSGANDSLHPVIAQNLYRLKNGRFEQVGQSWLKHGWCAVDGNLCAQCQSDGGCDYLGIGCSDPYGSGLNGAQSDLGPRSQVNAATGVFPFPFSAPSAPATIGRRLQVKIDDVSPALNPGALYFVEGHYVHPEDATANNDNNNASYRRATFGNLVGGYHPMSLTGATFQQKAAIFAWKDNGLGVGQPDPNVTIVTVDVPGDGRLYVASKVSQNGDGSWHYEYAIQNLCSDRSGQAFSVPAAVGSDPFQAEFHASFSHSGEPYSNAPWAITVANGAVTWATDTYATNVNANALRFSTLANFRFDAATAPTSGEATLTLFKPGTPEAVTVAVPVPSAAPVLGDFDGDGDVDGADLAFLLGAWGTPTGDLDGNGDTDASDLAILLGAWH